MAIAGMFCLLAWNAVMPDRRDSRVLGVLPVATGTICRAKIGRIGDIARGEHSGGEMRSGAARIRPCFRHRADS